MKFFLKVAKYTAEVVFVIGCGFIAGTNGSTVPVGLTVGVIIVGLIEIIAIYK